MTPIFIFSLPRSGSTLLQRILACHPDIATVSEPWILLPILHSTRSKDVYTHYDHRTACAAIHDFIRQMPHGQKDFDCAVKEFAIRLYKDAANGEATYFVDKTPRYHLIVDDILRLFPDAKFIFLWRNPLAVAASMITTWGKGYWNLDQFYIDLYQGLANLIKVYENKIGDALSVRYEDLLSNPEDILQSLSGYLGLDLDTTMLNRFSNVKLHGDMGDPTGVSAYKRLDLEPIEKWKSVLSNPIRKSWAKRYIEWLGENRLKIMGYDLETLKEDIHTANYTTRYMAVDMMKIIREHAFKWIEPYILLDKLRTLPRFHDIYFHR